MKTLVLGASVNPDRYSNAATHRLLNYGHEVVLYGLRSGEIAGQEIHTDKQAFQDIDTVTLYVGPDKQEDYADWIINVLKPRRIIFNPGTENPTLFRQAKEAGIEPEYACTLVLLSTGQY